MKNIKQICIVSVLAIALFSCSSGDENDPAQLFINFKGATSSVSNGRVSGSLDISEALIGVTKIELEMEHEDEHHNSSDNSGSRTNHSGDDDEDDDDDDGENEIEIKGSWVVDLLNGTSDPELPTMSIDPGQFNEIKVVLSPIIEDQYSVVFKATYTDDNGAQTPVELMLSNQIIFKVKNNSGFVISSEKLNEIVVQLEMDKWLSEIDLSTLDAKNGKIKISIDHNEGAIDKIKINIKDNCGAKSGDYDDDENDDD